MINMTGQIDRMRPIPENRRASAALVVLADIAPEEEAGFNEWYNREHMRDRVLEFPTFVRGRRYVAIEGAPKYFAIYDVRDASVFSSEAYVSLVSQPDPRSKHYITRFQNAFRTIARIDIAYGEGEGGAAALWVLDAEDPAFSIEALRDLIPHALVLPGVIAAQVLSADEEALAASSRRHVRQGNRIIPRALLLEAMNLECLREAAAVVNGRLGSSAPKPGLFQLLYRVSP